MGKRSEGGRPRVAKDDYYAFRDGLRAYVADNLQGQRGALAERLALPRKTIDRWFSGSMPDLTHLLHAARKTGLSLDGLLLQRGGLQWVKPKTDPFDQAREVVLTALKARTGFTRETLELVLPSGRGLVQTLLAGLPFPTLLATKLEMLGLAAEVWRSRAECQPGLVQRVSSLAKQHGLPWDARLEPITLPRRPLQRMKSR
jgi:hypothetical protein